MTRYGYEEIQELQGELWRYIVPGDSYRCLGDQPGAGCMTRGATPRPFIFHPKIEEVTSCPKCGTENTEKVQYLVDLRAFEANGACDCDSFNFNMKPVLERGENRGERMRCKHIIRCRSRVLDEIIRHSGAEQKNVGA
jgi:hypothetical protein